MCDCRFERYITECNSFFDFCRIPVTHNDLGGLRWIEVDAPPQARLFCPLGWVDILCSYLYCLLLFLLNNLSSISLPFWCLVHSCPKTCWLAPKCLTKHWLCSQLLLTQIPWTSRLVVSCRAWLPLQLLMSATIGLQAHHPYCTTGLMPVLRRPLTIIFLFCVPSLPILSP